MSRGRVQSTVAFVDPKAPPVTMVLDLLEYQWHQETEPQVDPFEEPLDGLILIILSQNTNDRNRDMAFERLKQVCPCWDQVLQLSRDQLIDLIRPAGLCDSKADTIRRALKAVNEKMGQLSLKAMRKADPDESWAFLTGIKGVGVKTAACVFVFDLGFPAFPVDTHVARFCRRMGWAAEKATPDAIQEQMEQLVPDHRKAGAHLNIILHGRGICQARNPKCGLCLLRGLCVSSQA